jgi:hypothetical protein
MEVLSYDSWFPLLRIPADQQSLFRLPIIHLRQSTSFGDWEIRPCSAANVFARKDCVDDFADAGQIESFESVMLIVVLQARSDRTLGAELFAPVTRHQLIRIEVQDHGRRIGGCDVGRGADRLHLVRAGLDGATDQLRFGGTVAILTIFRGALRGRPGIHCHKLACGHHAGWIIDWA